VKGLRDLDGELCRTLGALRVLVNEGRKTAGAFDVGSGPVGDGIGRGSPSGASSLPCCAQRRQPGSPLHVVRLVVDRAEVSRSG
jgi:hypothetical protein